MSGLLRSRSRAIQRDRAQAQLDLNEGWSPPSIMSIKDTGLNIVTLADLVTKVLYFGGMMSGYDIADRVKLPYNGVVDVVLDFLKQDKRAEVKGMTGRVGTGALQYSILSKGFEKAREILKRSQYAGACPVPLSHYIEAIKAQNKTKLTVDPDTLQKALSHLTITNEMLTRIGPAVNSGRSIFIYGPPGNGKTAIAEAIGKMILSADLWVPYAIDVDGQTVRVFDNVHHEVLEAPKTEFTTRVTRDPRWLRIRRPFIMVGGELTMNGLDLVWDKGNNYYEAPYQVKANGGMLLIDDFGRQLVSPRDLLNRWIVPLEKQVDYLTLHTGRKIEMPFFVLIVFATNMEPSDLVDEAFLRRIRHKIEVHDPSLEQFRQIFQHVCADKGVEYDSASLRHLIKECYIKYDRPWRCVHPRDLVDQIIDIARYKDVIPKMTKELVTGAAKAYFVNL